MNKYLIILLLTLTIFSCKKDPQITTSPTIPTTPDFVVPTITPTGSEQYLDLDSDYIFDQDKLPTFELNLPTASLARLDNDPAAEEYVEGSLTFEGETISPVGIRYKGSIGSFVNCVSGPDFSNPSGHKTCTKISMKIKINWEGRDDKFYGLKKLQFHSQNWDPTQMRDRLAYWLFREMDIPAPRAVHARLMINGTYAGLYSLVEQIDGRFTRHNFDDGKGNLYKEVWPIDMNGEPYNEQFYLDHLETNKDENPTAELFRTFGQEIYEADETNIKDVIANRMDVDEIIKYAAIDRTIKVDDGAFHWYCDEEGRCENHNYYWYENPTTEKFHLIPWDMDNTFENIITTVNLVTPIADAWGETSANCEPFPYGFFGLPQRSAACDKLIHGWTKFETEYDQFRVEFIQGPFSKASVNEQLDKWEAQIRAATEEAFDAHDDAISIDTWENKISQLKINLDYARNY